MDKYTYRDRDIEKHIVRQIDINIETDRQTDRQTYIEKENENNIPECYS